MVFVHYGVYYYKYPARGLYNTAQEEQSTTSGSYLLLLQYSLYTSTTSSPLLCLYLGIQFLSRTVSPIISPTLTKKLKNISPDYPLVVSL